MAVPENAMVKSRHGRASGRRILRWLVDDSVLSDAFTSAVGEEYVGRAMVLVPGAPSGVVFDPESAATCSGGLAVLVRRMQAECPYRSTPSCETVMKTGRARTKKHNKQNRAQCSKEGSVMGRGVVPVLTVFAAVVVGCGADSGVRVVEPTIPASTDVVGADPGGEGPCGLLATSEVSDVTGRVMVTASRSKGLRQPCVSGSPPNRRRARRSSRR